jgi:predicted nucleic acid-binding protein
MYISAITIGELTKGVALLAEGRRKRELSDWLVNLQQQFEDQILSVDKEIGRIWGELAARAQSNGAAIAPTDGLIAATALRHGHQVATRNVNHFAATGAAILNPWEHEIYSD